MYKQDLNDTIIAELLDSQPEVVMWYTPVWFSESDTTNKIIDFELNYCNDEACRLLNLPKEDLLGQTLLASNIVSDKHRQEFFEQFKEVWLTGERQTFSYYHEELGIYIEAVRSKLKDGIISVNRNRTKEYFQEQQLKRDKDLINSILDASINGVFALEAVRDNEGKIVDFIFIKANEVCARLLNKTEEEIIGKSYLSLLPPSKVNGLFDLKCEVVETGKTVEKELHYKGVGIDGWYNISIARLGRNGVVETFTDITESKRDKIQLEQSAERFKTVINASQAGMFTLIPILDDKGEVEDFRFGIVNQAVASYIGQTAEILTGSLASIYFPAYKVNGLFDIYKRTFQTGVSESFDFHYEDGYDVFFNINAVKMGDEVLVTFTDHTNLKRLQRELEETVEDLKRSNSSLEEFAYAASHDLQEPLRKVQTFANRLKQELSTFLNPTQHQLFERIDSAVTRMKVLIDDLLSYSQVSIKIQTFEIVDLNKIIQQVLNDLEASIIDKRANISFSNLPKIKGDERQLRQMFQNLISNALKYSKPSIKPEIQIISTTTNATHNNHEALPVQTSDAFHLIEVKDYGIGFEQEYAEKIFQVFQRLHGKSEYEGTGVGLAIVQKVVNNHKGFIKAKGEPGHGATFSVYLPADQSN